MADGASFMIDIATQMTGGDLATSQLRSLEQTLVSSGASAASFDAAIDQTNAALASASAEAASASAALAAGQARYTQMEVAANRASKAVEKAAAAGQDTTALQAAADSATAALNQESAALDKLQSASTAADAKQAQLTGTLKNLEGAASKSAGAQNAEFANTKKILGPYGEKVERLKAVQAAFGNAGVAALGAVAIWVVAAAALAAVAVAAVGAYIALAKYAITSNPKAMERMTKATKKLETNFAKLFSGVKVDKFVSAFEDVLNVFDEGTSTSKALTSLFGAMLNPLFNAIAVVAPYAKEAFKGIVFAALQIAIAAVKVRNFLLGLIPEEVKAAAAELTAGIKWVEVAFWAGAVAAGLFVAALVILAAVVVVGAAVIAGSLFLALMVVLFPFILVAIAIAAVIAIIYYLGVATMAAVDWLMGLGAAGIDAAGSLIDGLVNGIRSGAGAVYDALREMASQMASTITSALKLGSPSKLFAGFGANTALGFAGGVESETGTVTGAIEGMVADPDLAGGATAGGGSGGAITLRFVQPDGSTQSRTVGLGEELTLFLEGLALQIRGEVPT